MPRFESGNYRKTFPDQAVINAFLGIRHCLIHTKNTWQFQSKQYNLAAYFRIFESFHVDVM